LNARVFDVAGRIVANQDFGMLSGTSKLELNLESLAQGIYFVNVQADESSTNHKILWLK
jgi:hypothetical protein